MTPQVASALRRFKVMAVVIGIGLLVLVLGMVVRYGFDNEALRWFSPVHGLLYMAYLVTTADLGIKLRWSLPKMVGVMLAGVVPFFSFVMERRVARQVQGRGADTLTA